MRRTALLLGALSCVFANPVDKNNAQPPSGIGTGVTALIAPPGGSPPGCITNFNGDFGIAAVNISTFKEFFDADMSAPAAGVPHLGRLTYNMLMDNQANGGFAPPARVVETVQAPKVTGKAKLLNVGKAPSDDDETVTVRSTRTHTRTVTMRASKGPKPAILTPSKPTPQAAPGVGAGPVAEAGAGEYKAGGKIKAAIMYQISDGQVQAPLKPAPIPLPAPKPTSGPFAPLAPDAPGRISQIGDGQIQAPTGKPARVVSGPAPKGAAPKGGMDNMAMRKRAANFCAGGKPVKMKLTDGVLKDSTGRTGYVADNRQFQ
jgi:hypothetical protein